MEGDQEGPDVCAARFWPVSTLCQVAWGRSGEESPPGSLSNGKGPHQLTSCVTLGKLHPISGHQGHGQAEILSGGVGARDYGKWRMVGAGMLVKGLVLPTLFSPNYSRFTFLP